MFLSPRRPEGVCSSNFPAPFQASQYPNGGVLKTRAKRVRLSPGHAIRTAPLRTEPYRTLQRKCAISVHLFLSLTHSRIQTRYVFFTDPSTPIQKCKVTCNLSNFITKYFFTLIQVGFQIGIFAFTQVEFEGNNCTFT